MKRTFCFLVAWSFTMNLDPGTAQGAEDTVLAGVWEIKQLEHNGFMTPYDRLEGSKLVFKSNTFSFRVGPLTTLHGTYDARPIERGKSIALLPTSGSLKGKTLAGIYHVEGNTLKLCYSDPEQTPPRDFSAARGSKSTFMVLEKQAK